MQASRIEAVIEALETLRHWNPEDVDELDAGLRALSRVPSAVQVALGNIGDTLREKEGVSTNVADKLEEAGMTSGTAAVETAEAYDIHRKEHAFWLGDDR